MEASHPLALQLLRRGLARKLIVQTLGETIFFSILQPFVTERYFSSCRSDLSEKSFQEARRDIRASTTYTQGLRNISTVSGPGGRGNSSSNSTSQFNRSLPNMAAALPKANKFYPIHLLLTSNYRLPNDVDRCNLERHLNDTDFELVFEMPRSDFYRLPLWKRSDLKKRVKLF